MANNLLFGHIVELFHKEYESFDIYADKFKIYKNIYFIICVTFIT